MADAGVTLTDGALAATFLPDDGMVCSSLGHEGEELLELGGGVQAYEQRGSTFGIPLLYPWANRLSGWSYEADGRRLTLPPQSPLLHRDGATGLPIHGVNGASLPWMLREADNASLRSELDWSAHPELMALFPFAHRLEFVATMGTGRLSIRLTVSPTGDDPVPVSFGFHPYLTLPGSHRAHWQLQLPVRCRALLDERGLPSGEHEPLARGALDGPLGERRFDDSFDELYPAPFTLSDDQRRIAVDFLHGYTVAQIYAPADSEFICFEPMTAPVDALTSGRGLRSATRKEPFTAEFAVEVGRLPSPIVP
jgi:galactose mutarotase-like enzyme